MRAAASNPGADRSQGLRLATVHSQPRPVGVAKSEPPVSYSGGSLSILVGLMRIERMTSTMST